MYLHTSFITCTDEFIKWLEYKQFSNMLNRKSQYNITYFIKSQFVFTSLNYNALNCVMHMQFPFITYVVYIYVVCRGVGGGSSLIFITYFIKPCIMKVGNWKGGGVIDMNRFRYVLLHSSGVIQTTTYTFLAERSRNVLSH